MVKAVEAEVKEITKEEEVEQVAPDVTFHEVDGSFLEAVIKIIDAMTQRGAVRGEELIFIGTARNYAAERLSSR